MDEWMETYKSRFRIGRCEWLGRSSKFRDLLRSDKAVFVCNDGAGNDKDPDGTTNALARCSVRKQLSNNTRAIHDDGLGDDDDDLLLVVVDDGLDDETVIVIVASVGQPNVNKLFVMVGVVVVVAAVVPSFVPILCCASSCRLENNNNNNRRSRTLCLSVSLNSACVVGR